MLFANLLFELGETVLQRLDKLLSSLLRFLELLVARNSLLTPVLILLAHAVHVVRHEVNRLAEWVCASAQNLDSLAHELDILFGEALVPARVIIDHG